MNPRTLSVALVVVCAAACSPGRTGRTVVDTDTRPQPPVVVAPSIDAPVAPQATGAPAGHPFDHEARQLFRIAACAGNEPVPEELATAVEAHCALFRPVLDTYRRYV